MGWINTVSPRISSIQDNLIPAERAPSPKALDVNDKELRPLFQRRLNVFVIVTDKRGNDVEKHLAFCQPMLRLISLLLLVIQPRSLHVKLKYLLLE